MLKRARQWHSFSLLLCLTVFVLALAAKLSLYQQPSATVKSIASVKLWLNGQKMEIQTYGSCLALLTYFVAILFRRPQLHRLLRIAVFFVAPLRIQLVDFASHRFTRPPPSLLA